MSGDHIKSQQDPSATLPYEKARTAIRTGDIVFVGGAKSLFSWVITAVTRSVFSHVGIACWLYDQKTEIPTLFIVEANTGGRRLVSMAHYGLRRPMTVVSSPVDWHLYRAALLERTGSEPYGFLDLIGIGLKELFRFRARDFDGEVCSEMVATVLNANGFNIDETLSPGALYKELVARGCEVKLITTPT